jgi:hypothetical protein
MKLFQKRKLADQTERRRVLRNESPSVFSYYARGSATSNEETGRRYDKTARHGRYKPHLGHIPTYIALAAIGIALVSTLLLRPSPRVILTSIPGTVHRDAKAYQEAIEGLWKQSIFNRSKVTLSTSAMSRNIQTQFPELGSAHIQLPLLGQRATVVLIPAMPLLQLVSNNGSFYVASSGTVMSRLEDVQLNQVNNLPTVRDESGIEVEPGKNILAPSEASYLNDLTRLLEANGVPFASITLPKNAARQADVRLTGESYYIKFSFDSDPRLAVGTFLAVQKKLQTSNTRPQEYIDVRVDEKVFYR